jgi:acetyl esterase/lipase
MKSLLASSATLAFGLFVSSVMAEEQAPDLIKSTLVEDVIYGHKDGLALTLDVVTPEQGAKGVGVILVSSGGWKSEKSNVPGRDAARRDREHWVQGLLKGGYTLFVVRHGSTPRYLVNEMVDDVRRSVRFVRMHADRYQIQPERLGITSGSSGGHLSLMVGLTGDDGNPAAEDPVERVSSRTHAVVAWFPPTDMVNWGSPGGYKAIEQFRPGLLTAILGKVSDLETQLKAISPIYFVSKDDPPVLLIHGDRDLTVPLQQSKIFKEKYDAEGMTSQLIVHKGGGHTNWPGIMDDYPAVWSWFDRYLK